MNRTAVVFQDHFFPCIINLRGIPLASFSEAPLYVESILEIDWGHTAKKGAPRQDSFHNM